MVRWVKDSHEKYGEAVRLAPSEVSFTSGETAWQDIYGFRTGRNKSIGHYLKDKKWYFQSANSVDSVIVADEAGHSRMRRNLSHAFSDKALRVQESVIQSYVDLLVKRMSEHAAEDKNMDIMTWYNYTTFDIISDLTFGEPLYCLRDSVKHNWVSITFKAVMATSVHASQNKHFAFRYMDGLRGLFQDSSSPIRARFEFLQRAHDQVGKRLAKFDSEKEGGRADFFTHIVNNQEKEATRLSRDEMDSNAVAFLIAGSETTATILSGATYLLLRNPFVYAKLAASIRSHFSSAGEITIEEVNKLDYLIAVFQEALRYYPPVPTGFPRIVPAGGDHISGHYIPGGTSVYCSQHAMNHSERNYKDPELFVPERWLGEERYKDDNKSALNPFSFGPRNCLGKNLAYAEMRLILAKVLFAFDLELVEKERDWMSEQKVFTLWDKGALMIKVKPIQRS
ncbi:averantin hydroxylase [Alternaria panax]|uniref:Averantin hydroxylase n=1 Tax=Alternaria panax TaxID=48097 RepID=A0AAD4FHL3_9PLEO|nr:averantin hydroxylase [Alternaria panax]